MNNKRRKEIKSAYDHIVEAKVSIDLCLEEEQTALDSLPEGLQSSRRGVEMEENIEQLQECSDCLESAMDALYCTT